MAKLCRLHFYGCFVIPFSTDSYVVESFLIHSQHADADVVARNMRNVGGAGESP